MIHAKVSISHDYDGETKTASVKAKKIKKFWRQLEGYQSLSYRSVQESAKVPARTF